MHDIHVVGVTKPKEKLEILGGGRGAACSSSQAKAHAKSNLEVSEMTQTAAAWDADTMRRSSGTSGLPCMERTTAPVITPPDVLWLSLSPADHGAAVKQRLSVYVRRLCEIHHGRTGVL